jgi:hypothetical protein
MKHDEIRGFNLQLGCQSKKMDESQANGDPAEVRFENQKMTLGALDCASVVLELN